MTEAAEVDAGLRQSREQTVLTHLEAENRQDVAATVATFKPGAARTELPGEVADGPDAVAANYRELFTMEMDITLRTLLREFRFAPTDARGERPHNDGIVWVPARRARTVVHRRAGSASSDAGSVSAVNHGS